MIKFFVIEEKAPKDIYDHIIVENKIKRGHERGQSRGYELVNIMYFKINIIENSTYLIEEIVQYFLFFVK